MCACAVWGGWLRARGGETARSALGWYRPSVGVPRDVGCRALEGKAANLFSGSVQLRLMAKSVPGHRCEQRVSTLNSQPRRQESGHRGRRLCRGVYETSCEKPNPAHCTRRRSRDARVINATLPANVSRADYDDGELDKVVAVVVLGSCLVPIQLILGVLRASLV